MSNLHAVPNPPQENNETKELIKTVALTSAISSLVGVFAVAGGQAVFEWIKGAVGRKKAEQAPVAAAPAPAPAPAPGPQHAAPHPAASAPWYDNPESYEDLLPDALRVQPRLRSTGRRRGAPHPAHSLQQMFSEFEQRQEQRFSNLERRIDQLDDEDEGDEDE